MKTRALRFAERWLEEHVNDAHSGPVSASELADRLIADAARRASRGFDGASGTLSKSYPTFEANEYSSTSTPISEQVEAVTSQEVLDGWR